jgi:hypothetical protein
MGLLFKGDYKLSLIGRDAGRPNGLPALRRIIDES